MFTAEDIQENMAVYSADGHKLGTVYIVENTGFHIEKGFFFPRDYLAHYGDIREITPEGQIFLSRNKEELLEGAEAWEQSSKEEREALGSEPIIEPQRPSDTHVI